MRLRWRSVKTLVNRGARTSSRGTIRIGQRARHEPCVAHRFNSSRSIVTSCAVACFFESPTSQGSKVRLDLFQCLSGRISGGFTDKQDVIWLEKNNCCSRQIFIYKSGGECISNGFFFTQKTFAVQSVCSPLSFFSACLFHV